MTTVAAPGAPMRAAYVRRPGPAAVIHIGTLPIPEINPDTVLVRLVATAVNHVDRFVVSGAYPTPVPEPFVVGRDLVGTVVATGEEVGGFTVGEAVWCNSMGYAGRQGTFAEYSVVPADRLYHLPAGVEPRIAAAALHAGATAHLGLVGRAHITAGRTVFVGGGAGAVGSCAIELATMLGARVVASCSAVDRDWCRDRGAERVIDYNAPDHDDQLRRFAPAGIDVWWDTSGHRGVAAALPVLAMGAHVLLTAGLDNEDRLPVGQLYTSDVTIHGFAISNASTSELADAAVSVNRLLQTGHPPVRTGREYPLAETAAAYAALAAGRTRGRIVVVP